MNGFLRVEENKFADRRTAEMVASGLNFSVWTAVERSAGKPEVSIYNV